MNLSPMQSLSVYLRYNHQYLMELLIGNQVQQGVSLDRMRFESYNSGISVLMVDDKPIITRYQSIHYMEERRG